MKTKLIFLSLILIGLDVVNVLAQPANIDPLVYIRNKTDETFELVSLSHAGRSKFVLTSDDCFRVSPRNTYLALSSPQSETISVFELTTGESILEIPTDNSRPHCAINWITDTGLGLAVGVESAPHSSEVVDIPTGEIMQIEDSQQPAAIILRDQIPHLLPDDLLLASPDKSFIAYNKCVGEVRTTVYGNETCDDGGQIVVYDISANREIALLADTYQELFFTHGGHQVKDFVVGIEWSPTGRFLAYRTVNDRVDRSLRVFDTITQSFADVDLPPGTDFVGVRGFAWSSDGERVAFWLHDYAAAGMRLGIFRISTAELRVSTRLFQVSPSNWVWRSDNRSLVFVDAGFNLIEYELESEATTIIDTNVWNILTSR